MKATFPRIIETAVLTVLVVLMASTSRGAGDRAVTYTMRRTR